MALDRQSIEKKDFPIGRRGYDPEAVDDHLAGVADEVDELRRSARRRSETLASAASDQVRAIVEAAESSAGEIQRQAEEDARDIRSEAASEAQRTREQASFQAREYVARVSESTAVMLQRLDAMESELSALIESLRTGSNRLNADVQLLEGNLADVTEAASTRPRFEPEFEPHSGRPIVGEPRPVVAYDDEDEADEGDAISVEPTESLSGEGAGDAVDEADEAAAGGAGEEEDTEGARLIALNMALNGASREETDQYLAEKLNLKDRAALLDEVYSSVE